MHRNRSVVTGGLVLALSLGFWAGVSVAQEKGTGTKAASEKEREKAAIAAQKNCVVSNKSLGSMGTPIKVTSRED